MSYRLKNKINYKYIFEKIIKKKMNAKIIRHAKTSNGQLLKEMDYEGLANSFMIEKFFALESMDYIDDESTSFESESQIKKIHPIKKKTKFFSAKQLSGRQVF